MEYRCIIHNKPRSCLYSCLCAYLYGRFLRERESGRVRTPLSAKRAVALRVYRTRPRLWEKIFRTLAQWRVRNGVRRMSIGERWAVRILMRPYWMALYWTQPLNAAIERSSLFSRTGDGVWRSPAPIAANRSIARPSQLKNDVKDEA